MGTAIDPQLADEIDTWIKANPPWRKVDVIEKALRDWSGKTLAVHIKVGIVKQETPAARRTRLAAERLAEAEGAIEGDPRVVQLLAEFDGELVAGSVTVTH